MADLVPVLLSDGGDPNLVDGHARTCLHLVARRRADAGAVTRQGAVLQALLAWRRTSPGLPAVLPHVNAVDLDGNTALHLAAMAGSRHVTRLLLAAGAFPYAENCAGRTPCDGAFSHGHRSLGIMLERHLLFGERHEYFPEAPPALPRPEDVHGKHPKAFIALDSSAMLSSYKDKTVRSVARATRMNVHDALALLEHFVWDRHALLRVSVAVLCWVFGVCPAASRHFGHRPPDVL